VSMCRVRDYMTRGVYTVDRRATLKEVARAIAKYRVSGLAVVDEEGEIVGVVSDTDVLKAVSEGREPESTRVEEVMTPFALIIEEDATLEEAARMMVHEKVHRLFVVEEEKPEHPSLSKQYLLRPAGVLTSSDIVAYLAE